MSQGYMPKDLNRKLAMVAVLGAVALCCALKITNAEEDTDIIETKIGPDQMVETADQAAAVTAPADGAIAAEQVMMINKSLKNAIEENKKLLEEKKAIEDQVKQLRGQREVDFNRINTLTQQRDQFIARTNEVEATNKSTTEELEQLKKTLAEKESVASDTSASGEAPAEVAAGDAVEAQTDTPPATEPVPDAAGSDNSEFQKVLTRIDRINHENDRLKNDAAKVHYNMGNIYFKKGDYAKAAAEYKEAVNLKPYDAEANYNLAFVSGEFLDDQETALTHYQRYLYIHPDAEDALLVKEKIITAKLTLHSMVDSSLDLDKKQNRNLPKKGQDSL